MLPPKQPQGPTPPPQESVSELRSLLGQKGAVASSDELMLSSSARDLIKDEEEALSSLVREILDKNVKTLHRELRRILGREESISAQDLFPLETLKIMTSWKEVGTFVRDFLRSREGDFVARARELWNRVEYHHSVEEETLRLLTSEIPAGVEFTDKVKAALAESELAYEQLIEMLGIADADFNLAELTHGLETHQAEIPPALLTALLDLVDSESFSWEMDELREISMALKRMKERNFPQELQKRFEEIRKAKSPKYLYAFSCAAKSIFIGSQAGKEIGGLLEEKGIRRSGLEAALLHAVTHVCQEVLDDHSAPGAPRKVLKAERQIGKTLQSFTRPFVPLVAKGLAPEASAQSLRAVLAAPIMPGQAQPLFAPAPHVQPGAMGAPHVQPPPHAPGPDAQAPPQLPPAPLPSAGPASFTPLPPLPSAHSAPAFGKPASHLPPPITKGGGMYQLPPDAVRADIPKRRPPGT